MPRPSYTPPPTEHPAATIKRDLGSNTANGLATFCGKCVCGHASGNHIQPVNLSRFSVPKRAVTGGCLADLNEGICNCEQYCEAPTRFPGDEVSSDGRILYPANDPAHCNRCGAYAVWHEEEREHWCPSCDGADYWTAR